MEILSLKDIEKKVIALNQLINGPIEMLPTFGYSNNSGLPHLEVDSLGYHFVVQERGIEFERRITRNLDELLYWVFRAITFSMAVKYELENRKSDQDFRILLFEKQLELIRVINPKFGDNLKREIDLVL